MTLGHQRPRSQPAAVLRTLVLSIDRCSETTVDLPHSPSLWRWILPDSSARPPTSRALLVPLRRSPPWSLNRRHLLQHFRVWAALPLPKQGCRRPASQVCVRRPRRLPWNAPPLLQLLLLAAPVSQHPHGRCKVQAQQRRPIPASPSTRRRSCHFSAPHMPHSSHSSRHRWLPCQASCSSMAPS